MKEKETLDARYVCQITEFSNQEVANAAIRTLLWLEKGAPRTMIAGKPDVIFTNMHFVEKSLYRPIKCCMAGAIFLFIFDDDIFKRPVIRLSATDLRSIFSIPNDQKHPFEQLFIARWQWKDAKPDKCARVLRHYLSTGNVDWSK